MTPPASTPPLSLVVCTLGRREPLRRLLASLRRQSDTGFEIVLVDQNEEGYLAPVLAEEAGSLDLRHLRSARGLSRARNAGIAAARGGIVGFPDDDCWYGPDVVARVRRLFEDDPGLAVLTGRTVDEAGRESVSPHLPESAAVTRETVFRAGNSNTLFVLRAVAAALGGFDEGMGVGAGTPFQSGEETDFLLRCLAAGHPLRYRRDLTVFHDQNVEAPPARIARARAYAPGFGRLVRAHGYGPGYLGVRVARAVLGGARQLARGDVDGARERYGWASGAIRGYLASAPRSR